jgi:predicted enzyme related to lactoylglutathione lyase
MAIPSTIRPPAQLAHDDAPPQGPRGGRHRRGYFAVEDVEAVRARAKSLNALAPFQVHGAAAGDVIKRPWGERSFYATDPWGNELCFVEEGTLYT